jgi:hypothetical protein
VITVNSISGGKTSAFMAVHYPADHDVFACVLIDDPSCTPKDAGLVRAVSDKLGMDFIATAERDATLRVVLDLEQLTGRPVTWVHGKSFDDSIRSKTAVPNSMRRYCTSIMKIQPIAAWVYNNIEDAPVFCNIGIRHDEQERAKTSKSEREQREMIVVGKSTSGRNKWKEIFWSVNNYPLITDRVIHHTVAQWAKSTGLPFPADSNCVGCFWKPVQQLRKNWEDEPEKMEWFTKQERITQRAMRGNRLSMTWKDGITYDQVKTIGIQQGFNFGTGAGCDAGYCTD